MGELENPTFLEMLERTDPVSLGIAVICIFLVALLYRKPIYDFFETYVMGRLSKSQKEEKKEDKESEEDENLMTLLLSLQEKVQQMKETQREMISNQDSLTKDVSDIRKELTLSHEKINRISESQEFLIESDKEDKKAFITREYNYFCGRVHKIDLFSREIIEKIYEIYLKEGGNTFVAGMMSTIRGLPTTPQLNPNNTIDSICTDDTK